MEAGKTHRRRSLEGREHQALADTRNWTWNAGNTIIRVLRVLPHDLSARRTHRTWEGWTRGASRDRTEHYRQSKRCKLTSRSVIHPLVLLSVVDHAARVPLSRNKRVLGVLLGQDNGSTINVANSYVTSFA